MASPPIRVAVSGAKGRMGSEVVRAVSAASDMQLVAEADLGDPLSELLHELRPDALVDFTTPAAVMGNIRTAVAAGVVAVVGTTGLATADIETVRSLCRETGVSALIIPNFAIGAVLMMRFAQEAAQFLPDAEVIELHHENKLDAPSGTAIKTAEMIASGRGATMPANPPEGAYEHLAAARGARGAGDVPIHSVRLPGLVASQMVIFGGPGQTLTIRHDTVERGASFMPGVLLALRKVPNLARSGQLIYGLESLL